jgi:hypothetical protein
MTEQEFKKRSFRHSQPLDYINPRTKDRIECLLMAVNFDGGTFQLWPIPFAEHDDYEWSKKEIWVSYEYVFPPKVKLKAI